MEKATVSTTHLRWEKQFETGHKRIDFEHMIFFDLVMSLKDCIQEDEPKRAKRTINEIVQYAKFHFLSEENLMKELDYPGLAAHRDLHIKLINDFHNQLAIGDLQTLFAFLYDWFAKHTTEEDQEIANYVVTSR